MHVLDLQASLHPAGTGHTQGPLQGAQDAVKARESGGQAGRFARSCYGMNPGPHSISSTGSQISTPDASLRMASTISTTILDDIPRTSCI